MSDELVKRLREIDTGQRGWGYAKHAADRIEELEAKLAKAVEALGEAIYLLDPDEEDIAKETGLHRIVTTYAELTSSEAAYGEHRSRCDLEAKGDNDE